MGCCDVLLLSTIVLGLSGAGAQPYNSSSSNGYNDHSSYYGDSTSYSFDYNAATNSYYYGYWDSTAYGCVLSMIADGNCDDKNNNLWCFYDGGDCCECTCVSTQYYECGNNNDFDCLSPSGGSCDISNTNSDEGNTTATTTTNITTGSSTYDDYYQSDTRYGCVLSWMGDGECDANNNIPECMYDGGDCCECTCINTMHTCGAESDFNCSDPFVIDGIHDCEKPTGVLPICSPGVKQEWVIDDSAQALALAKAVNCTDGEFNVTWRGRVVVQQTIHVGSGTVLNITGDGPNATLDGISTTGLFSVVNASLVVSNIIFSNGSALHGGAIFASSSNLTLHRTSFSGNNAAYNGGAISTLDSSTVDLDGTTLFSGNRAGASDLAGYGGGLFASGETIVSFSGSTTFEDNHAGVGGGALYVGDRSRLAWDGVTAFFANDCAEKGGAINVKDDSAVLWRGDTRFINNLATNGGALSLSGSTVYWSGDTLFKGNKGSIEGGALFIEGYSRVSWDERTLFIQNSAPTAGAVLLTGGSHVGWSGATSFINNTADIDGGAVGTRTFTSTISSSTSDNSFLAMKGVTNFVSNKCSRNGGTLALMGTVKLSLQGENITFSGNSAGFGGGAVSISNIGIGPVFSGTTFMLNTALFGGGVHATGSGIEVSTENSTSRENPVSFVGCIFKGNTAISSGGAVSSASGNDLFIHTSFVSNTAKVGGAVRLAGVASIDNCSFVDNSSDLGEGPAVSIVGSIDQLDNSSFAGNFINCEAETYLSFEQSGDILSALCDGCAECNRCSFEEPTKVPTCTKIPKHSKSPNGAAKIEELEIDEGYWRAKNTSLAIFECPQRDACLGGVTGASGYCRKGHTGPYCSVCSSKYTGGLGFACEECPDSARGVAVTAVLFVITALALMMIFGYLFLEKATGGTSGIADALSRNMPLQSLKIIVVTWQIITQFCSVANVTFPDVYQIFLDGVDALNMDITWVIATSCAFDIDFHDRLLILTIAPLAAVVFLGATYGVAVKVYERYPRTLENIWQKHISVVLVVTFLVYSNVSSIVFQTFACDSLDDGVTYLRADYGIDCDSSKHRKFMIYAGLMIAVYPLGVPVLYGFLLVRNRELLRNEALRGEASSTKPTSNLWKPYKASLYYYEVLECCRRVSLTGVVVFIYPNTAAQIALTLLVAFTCSIVSEILSPYLSIWDAWLNRIAQVVVFLSMYLALLMKVDVSGEGGESQRLFEVVLVAAHALMILVVVVETIVLAHSLRKQTEAEPGPRPVRSNSVTRILEVDEPL